MGYEHSIFVENMPMLNLLRPMIARTAAVVMLSGCGSSTKHAPPDGGIPPSNAGSTSSAGTDSAASEDLANTQDALADPPPDPAADADFDSDTQPDNLPVRSVPAGCAGSPATTVAQFSTTQFTNTSLVLDAANIYVAFGGTSIWSIPKFGGSPRQLRAGQGDGVARLTLDPPYVYFTTSSSLRRVPITGGSEELLVTGLIDAGDLVTDSTFVYWCENGILGEWHGRVARVAKPAAGGTPLSQVLSLGEGIRAAAVVVDGSDLYYLVGDTASSSGGLFRTSTGGGSATQLLVSGVAAVAMRANATHLFALLYNRVVRVEKNTGEQIAFPGRSVGGNAMALDDTDVYWTVQGYYGGVPDPQEGGRILKAPLAGGETTDFANCLAKPSAIAVDSNHVYWIEGITGSVLRAAK